MANETEKKTPHIHYIISAVLVILVIVLIFEVVSLKKQGSDSKPSLPVGQETVTINVTELMAQNHQSTKKHIGYVTPIHSVSVLPFINGFVKEVHVESGKFVQEGQKLITLEQGEYKAQLDLAKASVMQAQAELENATTYYQRVQAAGNKAIAQADRDKALAQYLSSKAALAQAKARLAEAKVNYEYTIIKAPISGLIGTVEPTKGDYVSPAGTTLMTIIQTTPIQVVFSITDKEYVSAISETGSAGFLSNEKITLQLADGNIYAFSGSYQYTDNISDSQTNSVGVYVNFENPQNILLPNTYVTVYRSKELKDVVLIPQNQVDLTPEGNFITLADKHGIHRQKIEILDTQGSDYIIKNTFKPKQYLVKGKAPLLKPNQAFRLNIVSENGG